MLDILSIGSRGGVHEMFTALQPNIERGCHLSFRNYRGASCRMTTMVQPRHLAMDYKKI
jgi:hypothetical protein